MMSLKDDFIKHQILIQRLTPKFSNIIKKPLKKAIDIAKKSTSVPELRNKLYTTLNPIIQDSVNAYNDLLNYEVKFTQKVLQKYSEEEIKLASIDAVEATKDFSTSLNKAPATLKNTIKKFVDVKTNDIMQTWKDEDVQGKTQEEKGHSVRNIVLGLMAVQAVALTRTAINYTSSVAKSATLEENNIGKWQWIATLDNTCEYCEDMHGEIFEIGDEEPPAHANCNCVPIPILHD